MRTAMLRKQHEAAVALVEQIVEASNVDPIDAVTAYRVGLLLAKLTGLLRIHFAQEDKSLYPLMTGSRDARASATALSFQEEMGGLAPVYEAFTRQWSSSAAIVADSDAFRRDRDRVFAALAERIWRENEELYPLADTMPPELIASVA